MDQVRRAKQPCIDVGKSVLPEVEPGAEKPSDHTTLAIMGDVVIRILAIAQHAPHKSPSLESGTRGPSVPYGTENSSLDPGSGALL